MNYITGVLPDLDVYGVKQMTMEELFVRLLYEDWDKNKYRIRRIGNATEEDISSGLRDWASLFKAESWEEIKMIAAFV